MKTILLCSTLFCVLGHQNLFGQCDFITPPSIKKISKASREFTFSDVIMNGKKTTYLAVKKGANVEISTRLRSNRNGDYCPDCIVQVYWGIRGQTSVCANSFYGYQFSSKKSTHKFKAPMEDGIYYITMGLTLDYSCKNNKYRPSCSADDAFAVIKVGNPTPEKKVTLVEVKKGSNTFLKTTLVKPGCFVDLDKIEWLFNREKLAYDNQKEIPLTKFGYYQVVWSNCLGKATKGYKHTPNRQETAVISGEASSQPDNTGIASLIENEDKFILKNLIFDLSKSDIRPEAKKDLDQLAKIMKETPSMKILLEGHTDYRGNTKKNQTLSEKRVKATKDCLVKQGVMGGNIETKGWGDQKPLFVTKDMAKRKANRRVEIQILSR